MAFILILLQLIFDDDVLPAVDGKIVAWIEDETLSVRTNASKHPSDHQEDLV